MSGFRKSCFAWLTLFVVLVSGSESLDRNCIATADDVLLQTFGASQLQLASRDDDSSIVCECNPVLDKEIAKAKTQLLLPQLVPAHAEGIDMSREAEITELTTVSDGISVLSTRAGQHGETSQVPTEACADFCRGDCECLVPWTERCLVKSCARCLECSSSPNSQSVRAESAPSDTATTENFRTSAGDRNTNSNSQEPARLTPMTAPVSTTPSTATMTARTTTTTTPSRPLTQQEKWSNELATSSLAYKDAGQVLCSGWGDPHYTDFNGGHYAERVSGKYWLVRSEKLQIQVSARNGGGVIGVAVRQGQDTVIMGKKTHVKSGETGLSYNGEQLPWAPFVRPGMMMVADKIPTNDELWSKHTNTRNGGIHAGTTMWTLKLMNGVQVHFRDDIWALFLVQMPLEQSLGVTRGYCMTASTWKKKNLHLVRSWYDDEDDLFVPKAELLDVQGQDMEPSLNSDDLDSLEPPKECPEELRLKAEKACAGIPENDVRAGCVSDVCVMHDVAVAEDAWAFEELEMADGKGIPVLDGPGTCVDVENRSYSTFNTRGITTKKECVDALSAVALIEGVHGAQLQEGSSCQIVMDPGVDLAIPGKQAGWGVGSSITKGEGSGMVSGGSGEDGWLCWKVN